MTNQVVCPKCNGNRGYLGLPPAKFGDGHLDPVPMCAKCDIQMYDPVLRKKTVEANRREYKRIINSDKAGDFVFQLFMFGMAAIIIYGLYLSSMSE